MPVGEVLPANPDVLEGVDDLMQLSYLNEPSVLHNLHNRYAQDMIYVRNIKLHLCLTCNFMSILF